VNALEGIRIVDLSHVIAGPTASHYLWALGAEVIKIEHPSRGDALRHSGKLVAPDISEAFAAINAGKKSLAIDLRHPRMKTVVLELARTSDVFIENFRPGAMRRLGLDYEAIARSNPGIVYASISGFGQAGAWKTRGAYDHVVQAATGMMLANGDASAPPMKVGFPLVDTATGMLGSQAIMAALFRRLLAGKGAYLDISMAQAAVQLMLTQITRAYARKSDMPRVGNRGFTGSPGAAIFQCSDGWLSVSANTHGQFRILCEALGIPGLASDASLISQHSGAAERGFVVALDPPIVHEALTARFANQSAEALEPALNGLGVPASRVRTALQFLTEALGADLLTLPMHRVAYPEAEICRFSPGFAMPYEPEIAGKKDGRAPALGADTGGILRDAGLAETEIAALEDEGVIRTAGCLA